MAKKYAAKYTPLDHNIVKIHIVDFQCIDRLIM